VRHKLVKQIVKAYETEENNAIKEKNNTGRTETDISSRK